MLTEIDTDFESLTHSSKQQTKDLINNVVKRMIEEDELLWKKTWEKISYVASYAYFILNFYEKEILPPKLNENWIGFELDEPRKNADYAIKIGSNFKTFLKSSFLTECLFQIEFPLREINSKLPKPTTEKRIIPLSKYLLKCLEVESKIDTIKAPYFLRNSLHNWGIFTDNNENVTIRGDNYKFENGKPVNFATWENVCMFLEELFNTLDKIKTSYNKKYSHRHIHNT